MQKFKTLLCTYKKGNLAKNSTLKNVGSSVEDYEAAP